MEVAGSGLGRWKTAFAFALAAVTIVALYWLRTVILELFLALLLGILLDAIAWVGMRFLRLHRGAAMVLATIVFLLGLLAALALIIVPLIKEGNDLIQSMPKTIASIDRRIEEGRRELLIPYVMQRGTHLPPPVVIVSILVFGALFGTLGVVLAVPLSTAIHVWLNETVYAARGSESSVITQSARAA